MQLEKMIKDFLHASLYEDFGIKGDITSDAVIPAAQIADFIISCREDAVICGSRIAEYYFRNYSSIDFETLLQDGQKASANSTIIKGRGRAVEILMLERVILNFMQHLSGIATLTSKYVQEIIGTKAEIYDTRKTLPLLRNLQKYAVICGGGKNHRLALDSSILIKDNHIKIADSIAEAVSRAEKHKAHYIKIEVECDTLQQVEEAIKAGVDIIMLDNMDIAEIKRAVDIIDQRAIVEVSGGVRLDNVRDIAKAGVDVISVGKLTHSAPAIDIGLDII